MFVSFFVFMGFVDNKKNVSFKHGPAFCTMKMTKFLMTHIIRFFHVFGF